MSNLPAESALARVMGWWWTSELELTAALVELSHAQVVATYRAGGAKSTPEPLKVPRPQPVHDGEGQADDEPEEEPRMTTLQSIRGVMSGGGLA